LTTVSFESPSFQNDATDLKTETRIQRADDCPMSSSNYEMAELQIVKSL